MNLFTKRFPNFDLSCMDVNDFVYHFYIETIFHSFVEVSFTEYMENLKNLRKYGFLHHVEVHQYQYRSYNIFLEKK